MYRVVFIATDVLISVPIKIYTIEQYGVANCPDFEKLQTTKDNWSKTTFVLKTVLKL